ncbi:hypothetical protein D3C78_1246240 [compost metagenome]
MLACAFGAQPQAFIGQQLVLGKAVVQLDDVDVLRTDAGLVVSDVGRHAGHVEADHANHVVGVVCAGQVGGQRLPGNQHIGAHTVFFRKAFRDHNGGSGAASGRAGHQPGQYPFPEHGGGQYVFSADHIAKHRQWVACRVLTGLGANLGKGGQLRAVFLHVRVTGTGELADGGGQVRHAHQFIGQFQCPLGGRGAIGPG